MPFKAIKQERPLDYPLITHNVLLSAPRVGLTKFDNWQGLPYSDSISLKEESAMATMNISLPDQMRSFVEECVQSGRYANASDYVRDLIRRDHLKLEQLRQALIEGENSGPSTGLDIDVFIADKKKSLSL